MEVRVQAGLATLDRLNAGVFSVDAEMRITHWNVFMASNSGRTADQVIGRDLFECFPDLPAPWLRWKLRSVFLLGTFAFSSWKQRPYVFRFPHNRPLTGGLDFMRQDVAFLPIYADDGAVASVCAMVTDMTDAAVSHRALDQANLQLKRELALRERMKDELRIAYKLEAVGQIATGIAHEINTPLQYVSDSVSFISEAFGELLGALPREVGAPPVWADLAYFQQHVPGAIERARAGLDRVAALVRAMSELCQPERADKSYADVNRALATTLTVARSEYIDVADIELELGDLPEVACHIAELNQVFVALIVNAAHAIADRHEPPARGEIRIQTWSDPHWVMIQISDNGSGIPQDIQARIFDPFFTTKPIGHGIGQGLSIARAIIVDRHHGALTFDSEVGRGSSFLVRIPR